jgi:SSS family solute:Na+ symporter
MGLIFLILAAYMAVMTKLRPLAQPREMPVSRLDVTPHPRQYLFGGSVIAMTALLYIVFW